MLRIHQSLETFAGPNCPMCKGTIVLDAENSERVCSACGIVFDNPEPSTSFGLPGPLGTELELDGIESMPSMWYDLELPTVIDYRNIDASGKQIQTSYELGQLRRLDIRTINGDSKRKNMIRAMDEIRRIGESLKVGPGVAERAYQLFRRCYIKGSVGRRSISAVAIASVYAACKELGIARSAAEIEETISKTKSTNIRRYYNFIVREMGIEVKACDPASFVPRIASNTNLSGATERKAIEILSRIKDSPFTMSKKPVPLAAAALYVAAGENGERIAQLKLASAAQVTPLTIRKRSEEIIGILGQSIRLEGGGYTSCPKLGQEDSLETSDKEVAVPAS